MSVIILGGDRNVSIETDLKNMGIRMVDHWVGRKNSETHKELPQNIDAVIMLTKFLNHNMMKKFKNIAKKREIPVIFSNSKAEMHNKIKKMI